MQNQIETTNDFREVRSLLTEYRLSPSQQFSNRIATKLLPFIKRTVRRALYQRPNKAQLIEFDDAVSELYLVAIYAIQRSTEHPAPMGYVVTCIRGMFKDFLVNKLSKYRNYSYLADVSELQQMRLALHYRMPELADTRQTILRLIENLPPAQRRVAVLCLIRGYSTKEAGIKLNYHFTTVAYHLNLAKKTLKSNLTADAFEWNRLPTIKVRAIQLHRSGVGREAICQRLGLSPTALNNLLWRESSSGS